MSKRLKDVETLPADGAAQTLLGIGVEDSALEDDDAETLVPETNGLPSVAARANGL